MTSMGMVDLGALVAKIVVDSGDSKQQLDNFGAQVENADGKSFNLSGTLKKLAAGFTIGAAIKKTTDARESEFSRSCQKYGYALSASMYLQGYKAFYGQDTNPTFLFFVVEEEAPFESIIYYASDEMVFVGNIKRREAMLKLLQAKTNNEWSGYSKQIQQINLPVWAMKEIAG